MRLKHCKIEKNCRLCKKKLHNLLNLGIQPLANRLNRKLSTKEPRFPLTLCMCNSCKTIQIKETINPKILFQKYFWQTSTSLAARKFSKIFCNKLLSLTNKKKPFVVEIASNDGTFLDPFKKRGIDVLGIDPAKNLAQISLKKKIPVLNEFFNKKTAKKIIKNKKKADIIFARNVIAHVENIHEIVEAAHNLLNENGFFAVEFHYAKDILNGLQYDSIYHEHLFYFNLSSLKNFFITKKFYLHSTFRSPISGGAMVAIFRHSQSKIKKNVKKLLDEENKQKINSLSKWKNFAKKTELHKKSCKIFIKKYLKKNNQIAAYGASARSSTFLNYIGINNKHIKYIVDKNPLKLGRYTPGAGLKIINLDHFKKKLIKIKFLLLLAWNFKKEIINELKLIGYKGIVSIPFPKKIKILKI